MFGLSSFRTQLLLLIIGLFSVVLVAVFFAVNQANESNARRHLEETLNITAIAFQRSLSARNRILLDKARLLSGDFAFKEAVATKDHNTILSVLDNHRLRVKASVMMLAELDGQLLANTLDQKLLNKNWSLQALQKKAEESDNGEAGGIQLLNGKPYQLVLLPLFTPEPSGWIVIGFRISDAFSKRLAKQTNSEVSLIYKNNQMSWQKLSSTLEPLKQKYLLQYLDRHSEIEASISNKVKDILLQNRAYLSLILGIQGAGEGQTLAVLQRSLDDALKPYMRLRAFMLALFGAGFLVAIISAFAIARSLSRPLEALTDSVKRIDAGDYKQTKTLQRKDELGVLSKAVKHMGQGLQERDQVRDLLGKVVSPEIANELLSKTIELGGEERTATILFSDIRDFTNLCEGHEPKVILNLLNRYLSCMSSVIELHHGVIDKYIGDAIMALFGVPIGMDNSSEQAVTAAIKMIAALEVLNRELESEGAQSIHIGVGINSGQVVAGNMGSPNRLNYTVIGDSVNLASRLEGLTCYFGVPIIVSESTVKNCKNMHFRDLGTVQVKGKVENIRVFEPVLTGSLSAQMMEQLEQYHQALKYFKEQKWENSRRLFMGLCSAIEENGDHSHTKLFQLYLDKIDSYQKKDLSEKWYGELVFLQK